MWRPIELLILVAGAVVAARLTGAGQHVDALRAWIHQLGPRGPLVFVLIYVVAVVAAVPGSALTVTAGALVAVVGILLAPARAARRSLAEKEDG